MHAGSGLRAARPAVNLTVSGSGRDGFDRPALAFFRGGGHTASEIRVVKCLTERSCVHVCGFDIDSFDVALPLLTEQPCVISVRAVW
jgi:hypothetical protein